MFNFQTFLQRYRIPYVTKGPNVAAGNINIKCPWCGPEDPSHHLGIRLRDGVWGCWRRQAHRGRKPHRLVMALLNCDYFRAAEIIGTGPRYDVSEFDDLMARVLGPAERTKPKRELSYLDEFRHLGNKRFSRAAAAFLQYLEHDRGFGSDALSVATVYDMHYAIDGAFANRIILPIYMFDTLVNWTGRTITNDNLRYKTLTEDEQKAARNDEPPALINIKETVYLYDSLLETGGQKLFICEGPFDAIKVDYYGWRYAARATCLFSNSMSDEQRWLLGDLSECFDEMYLLFDNSDVDKYALVSELSMYGVRLKQLPKGFKDPGEFTHTQVVDLATF